MAATKTGCYFPNRNNNYTECLSTPESRDSTFYGAVELTQEDACDSKDYSFPSIRSGFINNSKSTLVNYNYSQNNSGNLRTRKYEMSARKEDEDAVEEDPFSIIYIRNRSDKKLYLLEFKAVDVKLIPVYLKHRTFEENVNDKCNQPYCETAYVNKYNNKSQKFNQLNKTYTIHKFVKNDRVSIMSNKKPLFPKPEVSQRSAIRTPRISDRENNVKQSIVYIRFNKMYFEIHPGIMDLSMSQTIDLENEERRKALLKELNMALPADLKNKATVIVRHKSDVLKFMFTLSEVRYSKLKITKSIGVLAKDTSVYIKDFSPVTSRRIYIALPRSTYDYRNPMIDIRRDNKTMKLNKIYPFWMEEQRIKRIKEYNQCRKKSPYEDIMDLKIGSKICYEGFNCINKAKGGTLSCTTDDNDYEDWVISNQKNDLPDIEEEDLQKYEATTDDQVPDWDLVIYSK